MMTFEDKIKTGNELCFLSLICNWLTQVFTPFLHHWKASEDDFSTKQIIEENPSNVSEKIRFVGSRIEKLKENRDLCYVERF